MNERNLYICDGKKMYIMSKYIYKYLYTQMYDISNIYIYIHIYLFYLKPKHLGRCSAHLQTVLDMCTP